MTGESTGGAYVGGIGEDATAVVTTPVPDGSGTCSGAIENWRPSSGDDGAAVMGVQAGAASGIWPRATTGGATVGAATGAPSVTTGAGGLWASAESAQPASK